ncbi:MAG TPA: PQQ-binding-like beta-propeller repeat protein [Gammaproteobacteria bacterium]|nr:PQQ-binding-like beta-propeller repeat protein [Gammaproteobacteria bacterium]
MIRRILLVASLSASLACLDAAAQTPGAEGAAGASKPFVPVTDAMLKNPPPADWLMWRRTYDSWGYSPLDQIDRRNVGRLQLVWTRGLADGGDQEGTPLVHDGVMYFPNPNDITQALDAATGDLIWEYRRTVPKDIGEYFPAADTNRNLAIYDNLILDNGADGYAYAINAETGELAWETPILEKIHGAKNSSGPIVIDGNAVSGRSCMPAGGPESCVITAFDAKTGKEAWRTRLIPKPGEPGDETWGDVPFEKRAQVGSWMVPSFDIETNRIIVGTSVTAPAPKYMLAGNDKTYLYHNSTLALDGNTGKIVWYFQHVVDHWDLDHPFERLLVETALAPDPKSVRWISPRVHEGEVRKVITGIPGKTGIVYTLDRETGEFLWARETVQQNVVEDINTESGAATVSRDVQFTADGQERFVCPSSSGGKNYPAGTYSPLTGLMYYPLANTCMTAKSTGPDHPPLAVYALDTKVVAAPDAKNIGTIEAISVQTGDTAWKHDQRAAVLSLMSTGGGLVFGGDVNGRFRAYDQRTGEVLWEVNLGAAVNGYPITYSVGGRQYVAVSTGGSGLAYGLARLSPELKPGIGNRLYVFALPQ